MLLKDKKYSERIRIINRCKEEEQYSQLTKEEQFILFSALQTIELKGGTNEH